MTRLLGIFAVALIALIGCSAADIAPSTPPAGNGTPTPPPTKPVRVQIPTLAVDSPVIDLALQPNGKMQTPPDAQDTGWYTKSPIPGQVGRALLAAHVNWQGTDGPFAKLHELKAGDEVTVESTGGATVTFVVDRVETHSKDSFPHEAVYGDADRPELVLVTCGGEFDQGSGHYTDNVIAWARAA